MSKNITSLKGWTITAIDYSAGYYAITLYKKGKTQTISVDADGVFDKDGMRLTNNA